MIGVSRVFLPFALVCLTLLWDDSGVECSDKRTTTENARHANSEFTPGQVSIPVLVASTSAAMAATKAVPTQKRENPAATTPVPAEKVPEKSPSVIQMLEGRENDLILWASIAVVAFLIGWICGGNYYVRRDRARSRKLRF
jgi:ABC-type uncharacterized transport system involved in gliding motility auxiliary subunit